METRFIPLNEFGPEESEFTCKKCLSLRSSTGKSRPFCWAQVGHHCFQKSIFERTGIRKWFVPHIARRRAAKVWKDKQTGSASDC